MNRYQCSLFWGRWRLAGVEEGRSPDRTETVTVLLCLLVRPIRGEMGKFARICGVNTGVGGMARYEDDSYHRVSGDVPGNPWFICTLWAPDFLAERAEDETAIGEAVASLEWAAEHWINTLYADTCDTIYKMCRV